MPDNRRPWAGMSVYLLTTLARLWRARYRRMCVYRQTLSAPGANVRTFFIDEPTVVGASAVHRVCCKRAVVCA